MPQNWLLGEDSGGVTPIITSITRHKHLSMVALSKLLVISQNLLQNKINTDGRKCCTSLGCCLVLICGEFRRPHDILCSNLPETSSPPFQQHSSLPETISSPSQVVRFAP